MGAGIDNYNVRAIRKRVYIPVTSMDGYSIDILTIGAQAAGSALQKIEATGIMGTQAAVANQNLVGGIVGTDRNARLRGRGNGTPRICDIAGLNMSGLLLTTANDGVEFHYMIPYDLDRLKPTGLRCIWTSEAAAVGARDITFAIKYTKHAVGAALAVGGTALDTTIAVQAPAGVTKTIERTARGIINANKFAKTDYLCSFLVQMTAFNGAFTENKYLLGVELDYMPRRFIGRRARNDEAVQDLGT